MAAVPASPLFRFVLIALSALLLSSPASAQLKGASKTPPRQTPEEQQGRRRLDAAWTQPPTKAPVPPTQSPTFEPTRPPTRYPTYAPTPSNVGNGPPEICGTIPHGDGSGLILEDYEEPSWKRSKDTFECNGYRWSGHWYYVVAWSPGDMYRFGLSKSCNYQFRGPQTNETYHELRDVNSLFEQMAIVLRHKGHSSGKVSPDDHVFSGVVVPDWSNDVITDITQIPECPLAYCVKIIGPGVTRRSLQSAYPSLHHPNTNTNQISLLYAFSFYDDYSNFKWFLKHAMNNNNKEKIFLTNHFQRCGCPSFCMEDTKHWDSVDMDATCYEETLCGVQKVFQIQYKAGYPNSEKASWASTGTTNVLDWFSECAKAMYGCQEITNRDGHQYFEGTWHRWYHSKYKRFPKVLKYNTYSVSQYPELAIVGDEGFPVDEFPLHVCEGECDSDSDCMGDLVCLQRNSWQHVPGCDNGPHTAYDKNDDFCYLPIPLDPNLLPLDFINWNPSGTYPLAECAGDCDGDHHCAEGLECFQRDDYVGVPGCTGTGKSDADYCYDPNNVTPPTDSPTPSPLPYLDYDWVYGLGGNKYYGWPRGDDSFPSIAWSCPNELHRNELELFGEFVGESHLMRRYMPDAEIPPLPCQETFFEPVFPPDLPQDCDNIPDTVFCMEMEGAICYARVRAEACAGLDLFMVNDTSTYIYDDVAPWHDACLASGNDCHRIPGYAATMDGNLTYVGYPYGSPEWSTSGGWHFNLLNKKHNGHPSIVGNNKVIYYDCNDWVGAYRSRNFTYAAGNRYPWIFRNDYGDIYSTACTDAPSMAPSMVPSLSMVPSEMPSLNPTFCGESYLTSEDLNLALVIDLSYSTYQKSFSNSNPVGDLNNDGKSNTILDAQVAAIQQLLIAIANSPGLRNDNCELTLIVFSTDAADHGTWAPLNPAEDDYNPLFMDHIKALRAPMSSQEVQDTNNGFTNFDNALDKVVNYFQTRATGGRKNLMVFTSDGEPNVRGDGDNEEYCATTVNFWNAVGVNPVCNDLGLAPGQPHTICRGNDTICSTTEPYQDCVRGPNECMNHAAVTNYTSELALLDAMNVERLAIGIGNESNIQEGSGLWMIDKNPVKHLGVLPLQALNLDELTEYLSSLCILDTEKPTGSPSHQPSLSPSDTYAPSMVPSIVPTQEPTTPFPTGVPSAGPTGNPTTGPTTGPTKNPTPEPTAYVANCVAPENDGGSQDFGTLNLCLRSSLGYTYDNGVDPPTFQEVNFIETLIRIDYDMSTGFCVLAFAVEPKERELTTIQEGGYGLEGYLCDPDTTIGENTVLYTRQVPQEITAYNVPANTKTFNQGDMIQVCVRPDPDTYDQGLIMREITSFTWKRDPHTYLGAPNVLTQNAIVSNLPAQNFLTSYVPANCFETEWCQFSSILFAEFYWTPGEAFGEGEAILMFDPNFNPVPIARRNLEDSNSTSHRAFEREARRMQQENQEDPGPTAFDMVILLNEDKDRPGLQNAGGFSLSKLGSLLMGASIAVGLHYGL